MVIGAVQCLVYRSEISLISLTLTSPESASVTYVALVPFQLVVVSVLVTGAARQSASVNLAARRPARGSTGASLTLDPVTWAVQKRRVTAIGGLPAPVQRSTSTLELVRATLAALKAAMVTGTVLEAATVTGTVLLSV